MGLVIYALALESVLLRYLILIPRGGRHLCDTRGPRATKAANFDLCYHDHASPFPLAACGPSLINVHPFHTPSTRTPTRHKRGGWD